MSPPSDIVRQYLIDQSHGTESGTWRIYSGFFPDTPDDAICVYDTQGHMDGRLMATGERIIHPGIQVMVRAQSYPTGYTKANDIAMALDQLKNVLVAISSEESYTLHNVSRTSDVLSVGIEEKGERIRHLFSINAVATIT